MTTLVTVCVLCTNKNWLIRIIRLWISLHWSLLFFGCRLQEQLNRNTFLVNILWNKISPDCTGLSLSNQWKKVFRKIAIVLCNSIEIAHFSFKHPYFEETMCQLRVLLSSFLSFSSAQASSQAQGPQFQASQLGCLSSTVNNGTPAWAFICHFIETMWHATVDSRGVVIKSLTAPVWKIQSSAQLLCSCSVWCTWWHFHFPLQCHLAKEKTIAAYHTCVVAKFLPFYSSLSRLYFFIAAFIFFLF